MRILVVEDDTTIAELFRYVLQQAGHQVTCWVSDFASLQTDVNWRQLDTIVSDQQLDTEDGKELFAWLAQNYPSIRRVMITGSSATDEQEASADKVLFKPVTADMLLGCVSRHE